MLPEIVESRTEQKVNSLIDAFLPNIALSEAAVVEAQMVAEAKAEVLRSGSLVTAPKIAELAGYSTKNPSAQPHKWKKDGAIFAIHHKGTDYYPLYALNAEDRLGACVLVRRSKQFSGRPQTKGCYGDRSKERDRRGPR
jgi:hypothetical protein